ncbi:tRNA lysidine(34) synthetase TilS [Zavarzinia compransoris]|uniref:tRNA lysidine(34) synthetase TilS n=1 Tax=Zavarzinia marina TaxID=2911065 RepID=UPI001F1F9D34|nr:tRNA lysidine(34) synthetase TilS [Zavarzinia marina]MCF4165246.1 tRNA lysidine(34) synthetase TilS [Zavarzinia marina]
MATAADDVVLARGRAALDALDPGQALALAVSGGADSLALLLVAEAWARGAGSRLHVLTVDHGLRPEAAAEAAAVADLARARGHGATVLRPARPLPRRGLEAAARAERYALMSEWCRARGVPALATGHSRDDQAETLLLRLQRGSGLDGLAAMAPSVPRDGIRLLRPLLAIGRADLAALTRAAGLHPVDDPMNHDPRFARVAVRRAIADLGLDAAGLAATAARLGRDRDAIAAVVDRIARRAFRLSPWGVARIDTRAFADEPAALVERALGRLIRAVGGHDHPPRRDRLDRLAALLSAAPAAGFPGATLGGCRFLAGGAEITALREARDLGPDLVLLPGASGVWDRRFRVTAGARAVTIAALGARKPEGLRACPAAERRVLPAVFADGDLIAVPALDFGTPLGVQLRYCLENML